MQRRKNFLALEFVAEASLDGVIESLEVRVHDISRKSGVLELHLSKSSVLILHLTLNTLPGELTLSILVEEVEGAVVEEADVLEHPSSLVKRASVIPLRESILHEEIFTNHTSNIELKLLGLTKGILTDELDDFLKRLLLTKDVLELGDVLEVIRVSLVVESSETTLVLGEREVPVDSREVLLLSKLLIKTPEDLHNGKSGSGDGISEITTRGRDGTDNGDGTFLTVTKATNATSTFIEEGKKGTKISGVTSITGHFTKTTGNFTKSLGPTRSRVSHHSDMHTLITEVLSKGNTSVNRSLTSSHGHVGGVSDKASTVHDGNLLTINLSEKLGELLENLSHFVTTLTATDIDNALRVGVLGESLRNAGLTATEGTGNSASTTKNGREERVEDTLTSEKRIFRGELLSARTRLTHRPVVGHANVDITTLLISHLSDNILEGVGAGRSSPSKSTSDVGRAKNLVITDQRVLVHGTENGTTSDEVTDSEADSLEIPRLLVVKVVTRETTRNEDGVRHLGNDSQRALNTIENGVHDTGTKLDLKRSAGTKNGITDSKTRSILIDLNGGSITDELNDLTDESVGTDTNEFVHTGTRHLISNNHCEEKR